MAIIDTITGYYGFTVVGNNDTPDNNGHVKKCLIAIVYPLQVNDVDIEISRGIDDWAVKMGNGDIIPLSNPNVIFINRDNAIVEFDMSTGYPSNSPCTLVYHSDTASFNVKPRTVTRPFEPNSVSGQFAFTVEGYGGTPGGNGLVNRLIASIPYPQMINTVKFEISKDPAHWGARMADGSLISLRDPEVMSTNVDNAVVKFTMDEYYPSNSPCVLVYRHKDASITIKPADDDTNFYPIADIIDVPSKGISGTTLDLNECHVMPFNASSQKIDWSIVDGPGEIINKHYLFLKQGGVVNIRATVENGSGDGVPFIKTFSVNVTQNVITILGQPVEKINAFVNKINHTISVTAKSLTEEIKYQWYLSRDNSYENAIEIKGETSAEFVISSTIGKGDYYYFCELISNGAYNVKSGMCHVHIEIECNRIEIVSPPSNMQLEEEIQLTVKQYPSNSFLPEVVWTTSNSDMMEVSPTGKIKAKLISGNVTITVTSLDGKFSDSTEIIIDLYVPVSDITNIKTEIGIGEDYKLSPIVEPMNTTFNEVQWTLDNRGTTGAVLANGFLRPTSEGVINIHATVEKGFSLKTDFRKDYAIRVINKKFTPVNDITIVNDISKMYYVDEVLSLNCSVYPLNASYTNIAYSIQSGPGILKSNLLSFTGRGNVVVRCTIINGVRIGSNFTKDITIYCSGEESPKDLVDARVPVTDIIIAFNHETEDGDIITDNYWDPFMLENNPMVLPYVIQPVFATNQETTITIKSIKSKIKPDDLINGESNIILDNFWINSGWEKEDLSLVLYDKDTRRIICDTALLKVSRVYQIIFSFSIKDGNSDGVSFEKDVAVNISTENRLPFIPLRDFQIVLPSKVRVYYPILVTNFLFTPDNASIKSVMVTDDITLVASNPEAEGDCAVLLFHPDDYDIYHTIPPLDIFNWNLNNTYMYPYNPGKIKLSIAINDCTVEEPDNFNSFYPVKTFLKKDFEIEVLPPFIPVKDIINIPLSLPANSKIQLSPEVCTNGGLDCYNPCWDEEVATNSDIIWEITDDGNSGTSVDSNGVISTGSIMDASFTLKAVIKEGTQEHLVWYDKENKAIDYEKSFSISIVAEEVPSTDPILVITLNDDLTVNITKLSEMSWICSSAPSDSQIAISDITFRKSDVKEVEFKDIYDNNYKLTSLKNFCRNFMSLTKITGTIPDTVTGDSCMENFLAGCTSFNQALVIPDTVNGKNCLKYFMQGCTSMNSVITLPRGLTGEGCLHGFLDGCTSFNQALVIPDTVTGDSCMENFLRGCTSFNQALVIPRGVSGRSCLRFALSRCTSFNQPLVLPDDVGVYTNDKGYYCGRQLNNMLEGSEAMCATITIPMQTAINAEISERTFSAFNLSSANILNGIFIDGDGADAILKRLANTYEPDENGFYAYPPYIHIRNLD